MNNINILLLRAFFVSVFAIGLAMPSPAVSANSTSDSRGSKQIQIETTAPLKLAPNAVEVVKTQKNVGSVIINNPDVLDVTVETSKRLLLRPLAAGATTLTLLSTGGEILYKRDVLVNDRFGKYVRIRRFCTGESEKNCSPVDTFYCPDGCYSVTPTTNSDATGASSNPNSNSTIDEGYNADIIIEQEASGDE